jgi:hypothetical protein
MGNRERNATHRRRAKPSFPGDYLRGFFKELERIKHRESWHVTHALTYRQSSLCVLISTGDFRRKVFVQDLNPDPVKAAGEVFVQWQSLGISLDPRDHE